MQRDFQTADFPELLMTNHIKRFFVTFTLLILCLFLYRLINSEDLEFRILFFLLLFVSVSITIITLYSYITGFKKNKFFIVNGIIFLLIIFLSIAHVIDFFLGQEMLATEKSALIRVVFFQFLAAAFLAASTLTERLKDGSPQVQGARILQVEIILLYVFCVIYPAQHYIINNFDIFTFEMMVQFTLIACLLPVLAYLLLFFYFRPLTSDRVNYLINLSVVVAIFALYMQPLFAGISVNLTRAVGTSVDGIYILLAVVFLLFGLGSKFRSLVAMYLTLILLMTICNFGYSFYVYENSHTVIQIKNNDSNLMLKKTPSIYILVTDGYLNRESLQSKGLEHLYIGPNLSKKGFVVYENAYSNYKPSFESIISFLEIDHHYYRPKTIPSVVFTSGKNKLYSILKSNGYKTIVALPSDYLLRGNCNSDLCYPSPNIFGEIGFIVAETIFYQRKFLSRTDVGKGIYERYFYQLLEETASPTVIYSHVLRPGHSLMRGCKDLSVELKWYGRNLEEANKWIDRTVSKIEQVDDHAIIMIFGDHGGLFADNCTWDNPDVTSSESISDNLGILMAVKWPDDYNNRYDTDIYTLMDLSWYLLQYLSEDGMDEGQKPSSSSYLKSGNKIYKVIQDGLIIENPKEYEF